MNRLDSGHNLILTEFYISHKKWHEVQQKVPYSVQHLKYLRNVALAQLGRNLERLPAELHVQALPQNRVRWS